MGVELENHTMSRDRVGVLFKNCFEVKKGNLIQFEIDIRVKYETEINLKICSKVKNETGVS